MSDQISGFIAEAKNISDVVRKTFGELSPEQLNWKPSEKEWSVGQCLDHLIVTNNLYLVYLQKVADGTHKNNFYSKIPFITDLVGKMLKKAVSPDSPRKIKTFSIFEASQSDISETIIEDFGKTQEKVISLMDAVKDLDIRKIKIIDPISVLINLRLIDALEIIVIHEKRHFDQAKRVMDAAGFPK